MGVVISTCFLLVIAAANFGHAVGRSDDGGPVAGPFYTIVTRLTGPRLHPSLVGMAFALSLDSLGQAVFFASRGSEFDGLGAVVAMACVFGFGMLVADAGNGALLAWFARRSDGLARRASRFSSGFIGWEGLGMLIGVGLGACTSLFYMVRIAQQRMRPLAPLAGPASPATPRAVPARHG